ncbi:hypothetical protein GF345_06855 [Candidatus Woesearchaeota archaeon]|nr:hypothetical protein [Candidatus Woesearchaeota archaeon]
MTIEDKVPDNPEIMVEYFAMIGIEQEKIDFLVNLPLIKNTHKEYCFTGLKEDKIEDVLETIQNIHKLGDRKDALDVYLRGFGSNTLLLTPDSLPIAAIEWRYGFKGGYCIHEGDTKKLIGYILGRTPWLERPDDHQPGNMGRRSRILVASEVNVNTAPEWTMANEEVIAKPMKEQPITHMINDLKIIDQDYAWRMSN